MIAHQWTDRVAVIDDFQVPDDAGYGLDDYGYGACHTPDYGGSALQRHRLPACFLAQSSEEETGAHRGCLVSGTRPLSSASPASPCLPPSWISPSESSL